MQGAALALSPATPALLEAGGHRRRWAAPSARVGAVAFHAAARLAPIHGLGRTRSPLASSCSSSSSSGLWNRPLLFGGGKEEFKVRASAVPESAGEGGPSPAAEKAAGSGLAATLQLGALFGLWYLFNIYFNIYNKQMPTIWIVLSLLPIVGGVGLASLTEVSFNWAGFWSAMASNLTFQSRNVLSKKFMVKKEASLDNITLFSVITMMSFLLLSPVALLMEGVKFTPSYLQSAGLNLNEIYVRSLVASLCFHAYQQVSYMILSRVSPVTHSVGNCVKRVVVIVTSVLFFRTPVSPINSLGTGIALAGVFLYSWVKRLKPKPQLKSA